MAFPCNQFGRQEPGTDESIEEFAKSKHHVTFDMYQKIEVNGDTAAPLWKFLKKEQSGVFSAIKWNFSKFLVNREGVPIKRFSPTDSPKSIEPHIIEALKR